MVGVAAARSCRPTRADRSWWSVRAPQPHPSRRPAFERAGATHLVEVLLWEGDDEAGWQEAVEAGVPHRIWMRLANVRQDEHPEDAIPIFQREVEQLIGTKNKRGYADAVSLMAQVRDLLASAGRPDDLGPYAAAVRTAHKPKRNLMKLLDQREWRSLSRAAKESGQARPGDSAVHCPPRHHGPPSADGAAACLARSSRS